jgi:hypothetical protein
MKRLINIQTNQPVVEFQGSETIFHSKFLENEMREMGIPIPHGLRSYFQGQDCIYLGDNNFQRAFKEVYYLTIMDHNIFQWKEER